ncbi:S1C family serine protease [Bacillus sp. V3B]|uniref:S1C family serine protease n=1 Tax=Bacillus sp. V3B TaxID=2804915 RepID=UPI0027338CBA|nr:trypsin-like peptidase domain-containing protein [Bacillus sp. V3B]
MGYYDHEGENQYRKPKGKKSGFFLSSLAGAVIGALLVIFTVPALSNYGLLPYSVQPTNQIEVRENTDNNENIVTKNVSLEVETGVTKAVEKAGDAVVGITNNQSTSFWSQQGGSQEAGTGSGVIYKKSGGKAFIVTNNHVIEGADQLDVTLADGTKVPAEVKGSDPWTDLAVIEVDGSSIETVAEFGDSDTLKSGEPVIAIGNPLGLGFSGSVTSGIISGLERTIPVDLNMDGIEDWQVEVLQTDAAINPGNSGGALINIAGQVIGINSMKIAQEAVEGIGLSIPINTAIPIIEDLEKYGEVKRPAMGIQLRNLTEVSSYHQQETLLLPRDVKEGVMIESIVPNSPANRAGLEELDVIVEMDGEKITDVISLRKHLYNEKQIGDQMVVKFYREGKLQEASLTLAGETY